MVQFHPAIQCHGMVDRPWKSLVVVLESTNLPFPWDTDLDIQTTLFGLKQLWALNGTVFLGKFLLDVNPNSNIRQIPTHIQYTVNVIDARFIDTDTGLFIDVTAITEIMLPRNTKRLGRNADANYGCKSPHYYQYDELFPLKRTLLQGIPVNRPNLPITYLYFEYHELAMINRIYECYEWIEEDEKEWRRIV